MTVRTIKRMLTGRASIMTIRIIRRSPCARPASSALLCAVMTCATPRGADAAVIQHLGDATHASGQYLTHHACVP